jgi:hypothetical protein
MADDNKIPELLFDDDDDPLLFVPSPPRSFIPPLSFAGILWDDLFGSRLMALTDYLPTTRAAWGSNFFNTLPHAQLDNNLLPATATQHFQERHLTVAIMTWYKLWRESVDNLFSDHRAYDARIFQELSDFARIFPLTAMPLAPSLPSQAITQGVRKVKRKWLPAAVLADTHFLSFLLWAEAIGS